VSSSAGEGSVDGDGERFEDAREGGGNVMASQEAEENLIAVEDWGFTLK